MGKISIIAIMLAFWGGFSTSRASVPITSIAQKVSELQFGYLYDREGRLIPEDAWPKNEWDEKSVNWEVLKASDASRFKGVSSVARMKKHLCTATWIGDRRQVAAPAYALTAAHCIDGMNPGNRAYAEGLPFLSDRRYDETFQFNRFANAASGIVEVSAKRLVYVNLRDHDFAVIELQSTVGEMLARGLEPSPLSAHPAELGEKVAVIGIPSEGLTEKRRVLRRSVCSVREIANRELVTIRSNGEESKRYEDRDLEIDCSFLGGSSGSPVFSEKTGEVLGVASLSGVLTSEEPRVQRAILNLAYPLNSASDTHLLRSCLTEEGRFDFDREGCRLPTACESNDRGICAASEYERQCAAGKGEACWYRAKLTLADEGFSREDLHYLELGCEHGEGRSCQRLGWFHAYYEKMPKNDVNLGIQFLTRACQLYQGEACYMLGQLTSDTEGSGVRWYQAGCERAYSPACVAYAAQLIRSKSDASLKLDVRERYAVVHSLAKACSEAIVSAFRILGGLFQDGLFVDHADPVMAGSLLEIACRSNDAKACYYLAEGHRKGNIQNANPKESLKLMSKACRLGFADACEK